MGKVVRLGRAAIWIIGGLCLVLCGCTLDDKPIPVLVNARARRPVVWVRPPAKPKPVSRPYAGSGAPRQWLPPASVERRWTAIMVHHSATDTGCAAVFDKWHRENHQWTGVGYHFVIGNGTGTSDGQVEPTYRWRQQTAGAHCKTPNNWANEDGVGICLVGNFDHGLPTGRQQQSLVKLVRFLQSRYRIPASRIYRHQDVPGARVTDCPGRRFSLAKLKSMFGS
jgi:hypothetical protein